MLLCPLRVGSEFSSAQLHETRTHFQRDYDRIIFSSPFRRLQNKAQVFPLPGSVFVHNRLTHSLEVASVGRSLGNNVIPFILSVAPHVPSTLVEQIPTIVATACLAHDLGNPPFGHSGEDAIRAYFLTMSQDQRASFTDAQYLDLANFEGNANALRLLTQTLKGRREGGFRLSYPVLGATVKYPWESTLEGRKKFGFFQSQRDSYIQIASKLGIPQISEQPIAFARHPLVYLVEAADDICYQIMDIEDAHKLGILDTGLVHDLYLSFFCSTIDRKTLEKVYSTLREVQDTNEQIAFLRAITIGQLVRGCTQAFQESYSKIIEGELVTPLIDQIGGAGAEALSRVKSIASSQIYNHRSVVEVELAGFQILGTLLEKFCSAVCNPTNRYSTKMLRLIPPQFLATQEGQYEKLMGVVDFIAGMTDVFALDLYRNIQGISLPGITR